MANREILDTNPCRDLVVQYSVSDAKSDRHADNTNPVHLSEFISLAPEYACRCGHRILEEVFSCQIQSQRAFR